MRPQKQKNIMNEPIKISDIQNKIFLIRGLQVMLDRDLAELYQVETRALKQAVKRNIERFPHDFMFKLTENEIDFMVSQNVIPSKKHLGGAKPYAFTEQGVSMLSAVLKSKIAIEVNIAIFRAFSKMRKFLLENAAIFQKLNYIEQKLLRYDENFEKVFKALEDKSLKPKQGIFYNGQVFDAYLLIAGIIKSAKKSILLIDNYPDETVLAMLDKRKKNVDALIYTKKITKQLQTDIEKHNAQYPEIKLKKLTTAHDRFLIIDSKTVYHFGASLKDAGKKWFAFSKLEMDAKDIIEKL